MQIVNLKFLEEMLNLQVLHKTFERKTSFLVTVDGVYRKSGQDTDGPATQTIEESEEQHFQTGVLQILLTKWWKRVASL